MNENNHEHDDRERDERGRVLPALMTDRELLTECVLQLRSVADVVDESGNSPMVRAMQSGQNPLMAMLGR